MSTILRRARDGDADDITRMTSQLGYDVDPRVTASRLSRILARADQEFVVAEHEGTPAGWVHLVLAEFLDVAPFAMVAGLVVDRDHRRHGIGRMLMHRAEAWARANGCEYVRLWSSASRTGAHRFYERLGYSNIKTQYAFAKALDPSGSRHGLDQFVPRVDP